ncbi:MAG: VOC family protein [Steroidobacteraceae bacterium]
MRDPKTSRASRARARPRHSRDAALAPPLGQFHELTLPTADIRGSIDFYERLGFTQALTGDVWPHPYGVLTDGRIVLGLHQDPAREASLTWVRPDVAHLADTLERKGYVLEYRRTGAEVFHETGLRDPAGHLVRVLEARTYSPPASEALERPLCGEFSALALHCTDFDAAKRFWEPLGFVAIAERDTPFEHLALTSDRLDLVLHRVRPLGGLAVIFTPEESAESSCLESRVARLRRAGLEPVARLPAELDPAVSALIESPDGPRLLLLGAEL